MPAGSGLRTRRIKVILSKGPRGSDNSLGDWRSADKAESILLQNGLKVAKVIRVHSGTDEGIR